jgi:hypothetical protein
MAYKLAVFILIVVICFVILWFVAKKNKPMPKRMRAPMMMRNGRVVSPFMNSRSEGFTDQYTTNTPINTTDPLWMTSVPTQSPWIGSIPDAY